jgi:hypothetical protein
LSIVIFFIVIIIFVLIITLLVLLILLVFFFFLLIRFFLRFFFLILLDLLLKLLLSLRFNFLLSLSKVLAWHVGSPGLIGRMRWCNLLLNSLSFFNNFLVLTNLCCFSSKSVLGS